MLDKYEIFKIKVIGTYIIAAVITGILLFIGINNTVTFNRLYNEYKNSFVEVTQCLKDSDIHYLVSGAINEDEMVGVLDDFGFSTKEKKDDIKELSDILIEIQDKCTIGRSFRSKFNNIYNAQRELDSLVKISDRYLKEQENIKLMDDTKSLYNIYISSMIKRELL